MRCKHLLNHKLRHKPMKHLWRAPNQCPPYMNHEPIPCNIAMCGINSEEEEEEENMDVVVATEKRPTWDAIFVQRA